MKKTEEPHSPSQSRPFQYPLHNSKFRKLEMNDIGDFNSLPNDIIYYLLKNFFELNDLGRMAKVSLGFRQMVNNPIIWRHLFQEFGLDLTLLPPEESDFRDLVLASHLETWFQWDYQAGPLWEINRTHFKKTNNNGYCLLPFARTTSKKCFAARFQILNIGWYGHGSSEHECTVYSDAMAIGLYRATQTNLTKICSSNGVIFSEPKRLISRYSRTGEIYGKSSSPCKAPEYLVGDTVDLCVDSVIGQIVWGLNGRVVAACPLDKHVEPYAEMVPAVDITYNKGEISAYYLYSVPGYLREGMLNLPENTDRGKLKKKPSL